ncbi:replicative DNA helicase [Actinobacillus equuli]|nr:replicative DNA helicase [Actinobacillus equuli]
MAEYTTSNKENARDKQVEQIAISPHSIEAEQAVLGGIMLSNDHWDNVAERIQPTDFYNYAHRTILSKW